MSEKNENSDEFTEIEDGESSLSGFETRDEIKNELQFKLVNAVKSANLGEISYHELGNIFITAEELKCFYLFVKALPYSPIKPIYPETPFLFFKGVPMPRAFDMSEETAIRLENFMKGQNDDYYDGLRLHDLDQGYLDAYESALRIYNDMVEKTRNSYHENVKLAKNQIFEISAVLVCVFVIFLTLISIS